MAGVDPISMAVIGAGIGAVTNPDDPIMGAILGGAGGFAGGSLLGAAGSGAAAGTAGGIVGGTGVTTAAAAPSATMGLGKGVSAVTSASPLYTAPMAASTAAPYAGGITLGSGAVPSAAGVAKAAAPTAMQNLQTIQLAKGLMNPEGQRTAYAPPQLNRGREVNMAAPVLGLLQNQPIRRRQMSLLG